MHKHSVCLPFLLFATLTLVNAQTPSATPSSAPELPYSPSLDVSSMDKSVDPCVDLYHYSCGGWHKSNPIPPDQTSWSVYAKLYQDNLTFLRGMLEQAAQPNEPRDAVTQKIGDFYAACMDESAVEKREFGRQAMRALLHPESSAVEKARYRFLDDEATWAQAVRIGPNPELRQLIPLHPMDPDFERVLEAVSGDLYDIVWWAESLTKAGAGLVEMRRFLKGRDPVGLKDDAEFQRNCAGLQKLMMGVVAKSKARFGEPWGMVSLFWSAGSPAGATGRLQAGNWSVARG